MIKIEGTMIKCFRGDKGHIVIRKKDKKGNIEPFEKGDKVTFSVKNNFGEENPILRKIIDVEEEKDCVTIDLSSSDTLIGDLISDYVDYEYDIAINDDNTILGHDESGAKIFRLFPSGSDDK